MTSYKNASPKLRENKEAALFTVTIETCFSASHQLTYASGEKEPLHKHNWLVRTTVATDQLDENGLAVDFIDLKVNVEKITAALDNKQLENLDCFKGINASAENVAKYIFDKLEPLVPTEATLVYIEVMEAENCWARYTAR